MQDAFDLYVRERDQGDVEEIWEDSGGSFIVAALQRDVRKKLQVRLEDEVGLGCSELRVNGSLYPPVPKGGKSVCVCKYIGYIAPDSGDADNAMFVGAALFAGGEDKPPAGVQ